MLSNYYDVGALDEVNEKDLFKCRLRIAMICLVNENHYSALELNEHYLDVR